MRPLRKREHLCDNAGHTASGTSIVTRSHGFMGLAVNHSGDNLGRPTVELEAFHDASSRQESESCSFATPLGLPQASGRPSSLTRKRHVTDGVLGPKRSLRDER